MRLPTGGTMILPRFSNSGSEVFVSGSNMDWGAEKIFAKFAEAQDDALDIGAHVGYYSCYLAPLVRRVFAFEPDRRNLAALRMNAELANNVQVVEKAVSNATGVVRFSDRGKSETSHIAAEGREIPAITVDDFVAQSGARPRLIKIDAEGHDFKVLEGTSGVMRTWEPLILTEFMEGAGNDFVDLVQFCERSGYELWANVWASREPFLTRRPAKLVPVDLTVLKSTRTKMIFLVPPRLQDAFRREAAAYR
jgi:FkbM family methyltransferase